MYRLIHRWRQFGSEDRDKYDEIRVVGERNDNITDAICLDTVGIQELDFDDHAGAGYALLVDWESLKLRDDSHIRYLDFFKDFMNEAQRAAIGRVVDFVSQRWSHLPNYKVALPNGESGYTTIFCVKALSVAQYLSNLVRVWANFPLHTLRQNNALTHKECVRLTELVLIAVSFWVRMAELHLQKVEEYCKKIGASKRRTINHSAWEEEMDRRGATTEVVDRTNVISMELSGLGDSDCEEGFEV